MAHDDGVGLVTLGQRVADVAAYQGERTHCAGGQRGHQIDGARAHARGDLTVGRCDHIDG